MQTQLTEICIYYDLIFKYLSSKYFERLFIYELFQTCNMPLNLTKTVALQGVRSFSHATWVSGESLIENIS